MRICYFGDAESIHIIRWCLHFKKLGHEVHLISYKTAGIDGVHVYPVYDSNIQVQGGNWKVMLTVPKVKALLRKIKPDILHAHYATSYGVVAALSGFHPLVITTLGSDVLISPKKSRMYRILLRYALGKADWITAMAEHMKLAMTDMGVKPEKISIVPFGIDPLIFNPEGRKTNKNKFIITSTRTFGPIYYVENIIKAVAQLKGTIPGIFLNLIGDGNLRPDLEKLVVDLGLENEVNFFGMVPQTFIADVLKTSDLFVSLSSSDGNNISLNEAMACGVFSVVTRIAANEPWIVDGVNGYFVPVNDLPALVKRVHEVFEQREDLQKDCMETSARIIRDKAIWSENMAKVEKKYKQLCSK